jgi:hypothetical protein
LSGATAAAAAAGTLPATSLFVVMDAHIIFLVSCHKCLLLYL